MKITYNKAHEVDPRVIFADEYGKLHAALLTQVWSVNSEGEPMTVNLVYVTEDEKKTDSFGQQIERKTSIVRRNAHSAHGFWFVLAEDELE